jgi:hypothetical protein
LQIQGFGLPQRPFGGFFEWSQIKMSFSNLPESLNQYIATCNNLFQSLESSLLFQSQGLTCEKIMKSLLSQELLLQHQVDELIANQSLNNEIQSIQSSIAAADNEIIEFASGLGELEELLYDLTASGSGSDNDFAAEKLPQNNFTIHEILILAEKLGIMSFSPADFLERKGITASKPPAPLEQVMATSKLNLSVQQLIEISRNKELSAASDKKSLNETIESAAVDMERLARESADRSRIAAQQSAARLHTQQLLQDFSMELNNDSDQDTDDSDA